MELDGGRRGFGSRRREERASLEHGRARICVSHSADPDVWFCKRLRLTSIPTTSNFCRLDSTMKRVRSLVEHVLLLRRGNRCRGNSAKFLDENIIVAICVYRSIYLQFVYVLRCWISMHIAVRDTLIWIFLLRFATSKLDTRDSRKSARLTSPFANFVDFVVSIQCLELRTINRNNFRPTWCS